MGWLDRLFGSKPAPAPPATPAGEARQPPDPVGGHVRAVYGGQEPFLYGAHVQFRDGGPDPLDAVEVYWNEVGPHWHYVGRGLAERGFELGFRLAASPAERGGDTLPAGRAPIWPVGLLNMLARRVHRTGRPFAHGHHWEGQPGLLRPHAGFHFLAFALDPQLQQAGEVRLLTAAAVDAATVAAMKEDEREGRGDTTLERLLAENPLLVTDLGRFG